MDLKRLGELVNSEDPNPSREEFSIFTMNMSNILLRVEMPSLVLYNEMSLHSQGVIHYVSAPEMAKLLQYQDRRDSKVDLAKSQDMSNIEYSQDDTQRSATDRSTLKR